jgi:hypothetical protein
MSETDLQQQEEANVLESDDHAEPAIEPTKTVSSVPLCRSCNKRRAREGCTVKGCFSCCDDTFCDVHMKIKEQKAWKEKVLAGATDVQQQAALLRRNRLTPGTFREPLFQYVGDSIVLWNLREYVKNSKWREEAFRKSKRRSAGITQNIPNCKRRSLNQIVDELYEKSLRDES